MIFRQLFEPISCTYTYLLGGRPGGEALIIDPEPAKADHYLRLLDEMDLTLAIVPPLLMLFAGTLEKSRLKAKVKPSGKTGGQLKPAE